MASFRDQLVPIISQGLERFANSTLDRVTNNIPFSTNGIVSGRPSQKYSTENLEFPFNVASADRGIGNHGHYIMFYINTQDRAKLRTSGEAGGGSVVDDVSQGYEIPQYIRKFNTVSQTYQTAKNDAANAKLLNNNLDKIDPGFLKALGKDRVAGNRTSNSRYQSKGSTVKIKRAQQKD